MWAGLNEVELETVAVETQTAKQARYCMLQLPAQLEGFEPIETLGGLMVNRLGEVERELIIFKGRQHLSAEEAEQSCPCCGGKLRGNGTSSIKLIHVPIGKTTSILDIEKPERRCTECGRTVATNLPYKSPNARITKECDELICNILALQSMANTTIEELTGVGRDTIKKVDVARMKRLYTELDENGKRRLKKPTETTDGLGIDEFKLHVNVFATHIIDLRTGKTLWIQAGKKKQVVYDFIDHVGTEWMQNVKVVACDMNSDFEEAFRERCPHIETVFDHFHIVENFNEMVLDEVRKDEQERLRKEGKFDEAKRFKRTKYLLRSTEKSRKRHDEMAAGGATRGKDSTIFNLKSYTIKGGQQERYQDLISRNELLFVADYVKVALDDAFGATRMPSGELAYNCNSMEEMQAKIEDIIEHCMDTKNPHFERFGRLLKNHLPGIVTHAKYHVSSGKIEGMNNRIKAVRRIGFGYADDEYFFFKVIDTSRSKCHVKERARKLHELGVQEDISQPGRRKMIVFRLTDGLPVS